MTNYAKVVVKGSPITKSNFKLHNLNGRAILPYNSGKYNDRYALYEQEIALIARSQNPDVILSESLIAILNVYYKSEKRHPDTINITKSIFDGIEKSGLIVNDSQITQIITQEYYDKENPRFELELFAESSYDMNFTITKKETPSQPKFYKSLKKISRESKNPLPIEPKKIIDNKICTCCNKPIISDNYISADGGKTFICKNCFKKLF